MIHSCTRGMLALFSVLIALFVVTSALQHVSDVGDRLAAMNHGPSGGKLGEYKPKLLTDFRRNFHSQHGEDGIIEEIFRRIGTTKYKTAIEFGAWDGKFLSNTYHLWGDPPPQQAAAHAAGQQAEEQQPWSAILLEMDPAKYAELVRNIAPLAPRVVAINRAVGVGVDSLENILIHSGILPWPYEADDDRFDLLSVDIDSSDYYILDSLQVMRPRVVVCEYNPTIPAHLDIYADFGDQMGASIAALDRVMRSKGYTLVSVTDTNGIWVRSELVTAHLSDFTVDLDAIRVDRYVSFLITDYLGRYLIVRKEIPGNTEDPGTFPHKLTLTTNSEASPYQLRGHDTHCCTVITLPAPAAGADAATQTETKNAVRSPDL